MKNKTSTSKFQSVFIPVLLSTALSVGLFLFRYLDSQSSRYWFLLWNLLLAWLPVLFITLLIRWLQKGRWLSWKGILLSVLWLTFLPNTFYLVTDFIHLKPTTEVSLLYDGVMFMTFAWNGLLLGFITVYIFHRELLKRLPVRRATEIIAGVFILSGFAIYLGRYLTWNTWDLVVNPAGILVDLSNRIVQPSLYPNTFTTTAIFAVTLPVLYYSIYGLIRSAMNERD